MLVALAIFVWIGSTRPECPCCLFGRAQPFGGAIFSVQRRPFSVRSRISSSFSLCVYSLPAGKRVSPRLHAYDDEADDDDDVWALSWHDAPPPPIPSSARPPLLLRRASPPPNGPRGNPAGQLLFVDCPLTPSTRATTPGAERQAAGGNIRGDLRGGGRDRFAYLVGTIDRARDDGAKNNTMQQEAPAGGARRRGTEME